MDYFLVGHDLTVVDRYRPIGGGSNCRPTDRNAAIGDARTYRQIVRCCSYSRCCIGAPEITKLAHSCSDKCLAPLGSRLWGACAVGTPAHVAALDPEVRTASASLKD